METTSVNVLQKAIEHQNNALQQKLVHIESNLEHKVDSVARKLDQNNRLLEQIKSKIEMAEWRRDLDKSTNGTLIFLGLIGVCAITWIFIIGKALSH
jgi:predicted Holliday junction resolvase-like endonuclease